MNFLHALNQKAYLMKKYLLVLCFFLVSCTGDNLILSNKRKNEYCIDMERFKIFQTLPANYALANNCKKMTKIIALEPLYC